MRAQNSNPLRVKWGNPTLLYYMYLRVTQDTLVSKRATLPWVPHHQVVGKRAEGRLRKEPLAPAS